MKGKKAITGLPLLVVAALAIVIIFLILLYVDLSRLVSIKSQAEVYMEINDQTAKVISLLNTKKGDVSYMDVIAYRLATGNGIDDVEAEINELANTMDIGLILYDRDGSQKKTFGKRTAGDKIYTDIPLPNGESATIGIVMVARVPIGAGFAQEGGWIGTCTDIVRKAKEYLGCPYDTTNAIQMSEPENCRKYGLTCATFVESVFKYSGVDSQHPRGNGGAICDDSMMEKIGTDPSVLKPGDVFSSSSTDPAGHTGIYVGKGSVGADGQTYTPDATGDYVFIHSVGPVRYTAYKELFKPTGKRDLYSFCRHKEVRCSNVGETQSPASNQTSGGAQNQTEGAGQPVQDMD